MAVDTTIAGLFQAVYEAPKDLERRRVLADALLERDDPRGEFITLQLDSAARSRKRAQKLLDRHEHEWVRPLRAALVDVSGELRMTPRNRLGHTAWRHGFLVSAHVRLRGELMSEPSWATLETLCVYGHGEPAELASPWMRSLLAVSIATGPRRVAGPLRDLLVQERDARRVAAGVTAVLERAGQAAALRKGVHVAG